MTELEDRLRDAYRGATDTVRPDSIRGLGERVTVRSGQGRWWTAPALPRFAAPLTAAAAVLVVGVIAVVVVPKALHDARNQAGRGPGNVALTGNPATHFLVGLPTTGARNLLSVRSAISGAVVATLAAPPGSFFGAAATADGSSYVVAVSQPGQCRTSLGRFTISRSGQPSRLVLVRPAPGWPIAIDYLAVSRDGATLAVAGSGCPRQGVQGYAGPGRAEVGAITLNPTSKTGWTARARFWTVPGLSTVNSLSLTADGRQIAFSTDLTTRYSSAIYALATNAAPGPAARRGRLVIDAARFGRSAEITSAVMTPDGRTIYFGTDQTGPAFSGRWALRAASVSTGQSRLIAARAGFALRLTANPSGHELIAYGLTGQPPAPSPEPSPSGSPVPVPSGSPTPVPSGSPSPSPLPSSPSLSPSPSPIPSSPSNSPSPVPVPSGSPTGPSPVPSVSPSQTPVPSASPSAPTTLAAILAASVRRAGTFSGQPFEIFSIQLPGGRITNLNPSTWDVAGSYFAW